MGNCSFEFLPGRNPHIPWEFPGSVDLSHGKLLICMYVWISPGETSKHTCKFEFLPGRNPHIPWDFQDLWISPMGNCSFACMFGFLPGRNPNIHANVHFPLRGIHAFPKNSVIGRILQTRNAHLRLCLDFSRGEIHKCSTWNSRGIHTIKVSAGI